MRYRSGLRRQAFVLVAVLIAPLFIQSVTAQSDPQETTWNFASTPDFLNADVADVRSAPNWKPTGSGKWVGKGNAKHPIYEETINYILDAVAADKPEFVLAAGDIVNGEWNRYSQGKGRKIFGPTNTPEQAVKAMKRAASFFYPRWIERFISRGLTPYPAVGDHELGDNSWPPGSQKSNLVPVYRKLFATYMTRNKDGRYRFDLRPKNTPQEGTAYAFQHNNMLVVTVDLHHQPDPNKKIGDHGSVATRLGKGQLNWFKDVLKKANNQEAIDFIIVQGHYPAIKEVRYSTHSSHFTVEGGTDSAFWKVMEKYNVDLYFAGEIHETTTSRKGGVIQVVHGGWLSATPKYTFLQGTVRGEKLHMKLKRIKVDHLKKDGKPMSIWQNEYPVRIPTVQQDYGVKTVGEMVIDKTSGQKEITRQTGRFQFYDGSKNVLPHDFNYVSPDSE